MLFSVFQGTTALMKQCGLNYCDNVKYLLAAKADVFEVDKHDRTVLFYINGKDTGNAIMEAVLSVDWKSSSLSASAARRRFPTLQSFLHQVRHS